MDRRFVDIPGSRHAGTGTAVVHEPARKTRTPQVYPLPALEASRAGAPLAAWIVLVAAVLSLAGTPALALGVGGRRADVSPPAEDAGQGDAAGAGAHRPYVLGVEDVIQVDVWKNPELTQEQAIRPDGRIAFKLIGEVQVEGLTVEQLRQRLTEMYHEYVPAAEVSVVVKEINSFKVYILGKIEQPGEYKAASGLTMLQVLALSGPFLPYANVKEIKVFRRTDRGDRVLTFNYRDVVRGAAGDMELLPGDRIVVP